MSKSKKAPAKSAGLPKDQIVAIIKRLESGQSALIEESKKLGHPSNNSLRNALRAHLGGKAPYTAMIARAMKARGEKETGGKKTSSKKEKPQPPKATA